MKMIGETIRTEFEALKNDFETIRQQIEDDVVRTELYKGEFYELTPYSYQRNGCKQGKPVKRPDTIKSTKNLCIYGFNNQNQIVEVKVGCSIENQFYHTFLYYTDNLVKSILYDNGKHLMNVCHYFFEGGRTASFLQIGNAVPPLMASAIAKKLKEQLMEEEANG